MMFKQHAISRFLMLVMSVCIAAHLTACMSDDVPETIDYVRVGDPLPAFEVVLSDGTKVDSQSLAGKTVVLCFFSTTCSDCQTELPVLQQFYERVADDAGVMVIAISRGERQDIVASYWNEHNLTIPYSAQSDNHVYNLFASRGVPRIYIADSAGRIIGSFTDVILPDVQTLLDAI